jgi:hypothetical protein
VQLHWANNQPIDKRHGFSGSCFLRCLRQRQRLGAFTVAYEPIRKPPLRPQESRKVSGHLGGEVMLGNHAGGASNECQGFFRSHPLYVISLSQPLRWVSVEVFYNSQGDRNANVCDFIANLSSLFKLLNLSARSGLCALGADLRLIVFEFVTESLHQLSSGAKT